MNPRAIERPQASSSSSVIVRTSTPMGAEATELGSFLPTVCSVEGVLTWSSEQTVLYGRRLNQTSEPIPASNASAIAANVNQSVISWCTVSCDTADCPSFAYTCLS